MSVKLSTGQNDKVVDLSEVRCIIQFKLGKNKKGKKVGNDSADSGSLCSGCYWCWYDLK